MKEILVIASLNVDYTNYVINLPEPGQTIFSTHFKRSPGGKGNNVATNLQRSGSKVNIIGCIGNDENGNYLKSHLTSLNIETSNIVQLNNRTTGFAHINVDKNGENTIVVYSGANNDLAVEHVPSELIIKCDIVVATLESPLAVIESVFKRAKAENKLTVLNYSPFIVVDIEIMKTVEILVLNEHELNHLMVHYNESSIEDFLEITGIKWIICTKGGKGVNVISKTGTSEYKGFQVDVVDTAGAGDAFLAGVVAGLAKSTDIGGSIELGQRYGAICVSKEGCQVDLPCMTDVLNMSFKK